MDSNRVKHNSTFQLVQLLRGEPEARSVKLIVNEGADLSDGSDDEIIFEESNGSRSRWSVRRGRYGLFLNEASVPGEEWKMTRWLSAAPRKRQEFCSDVWQKLDEERAAAIGPK